MVQYDNRDDTEEAAKELMKAKKAVEKVLKDEDYGAEFGKLLQSERADSEEQEAESSAEKEDFLIKKALFDKEPALRKELDREKDFDREKDSETEKEKEELEKDKELDHEEEGKDRNEHEDKDKDKQEQESEDKSEKDTDKESDKEENPDKEEPFDKEESSDKEEQPENEEREADSSEDKEPSEDEDKETDKEEKSEDDNEDKENDKDEEEEKEDEEEKDKEDEEKEDEEEEEDEEEDEDDEDESEEKTEDESEDDDNESDRAEEESDDDEDEDDEDDEKSEEDEDEEDEDRDSDNDEEKNSENDVPSSSDDYGPDIRIEDASEVETENETDPADLGSDTDSDTSKETDLSDLETDKESDTDKQDTELDSTPDEAEHETAEIIDTDSSLASADVQDTEADSETDDIIDTETDTDNNSFDFDIDDYGMHEEHDISYDTSQELKEELKDIGLSNVEDKEFFGKNNDNKMLEDSKMYKVVEGIDTARDIVRTVRDPAEAVKHEIKEKIGEGLSKLAFGDNKELADDFKTVTGSISEAVHPDEAITSAFKTLVELGATAFVASHFGIPLIAARTIIEVAEFAVPIIAVAGYEIGKEIGEFIEDTFSAIGDFFSDVFGSDDSDDEPVGEIPITDGTVDALADLFNGGTAQLDPVSVMPMETFSASLSNAIADIQISVAQAVNEETDNGNDVDIDTVLNELRHLCDYRMDHETLEMGLEVSDRASFPIAVDERDLEQADDISSDADVTAAEDDADDEEADIGDGTYIPAFAGSIELVNELGDREFGNSESFSGSVLNYTAEMDFSDIDPENLSSIEGYTVSEERDDLSDCGRYTSAAICFAETLDIEPDRDINIGDSIVSFVDDICAAAGLDFDVTENDLITNQLMYRELEREMMRMIENDLRIEEPSPDSREDERDRDKEQDNDRDDYRDHDTDYEDKDDSVLLRNGALLKASDAERESDLPTTSDR